jgi:hypothetical protein
MIAQGVDEAWRYTLDTTPVSGTATGTPTLTVYDESNWSDVTGTVVSGTCSLFGATITTGIISLLRRDATYFCLLNWSVGSSQTRSRFFRLRGER